MVTSRMLSICTGRRYLYLLVAAGLKGIDTEPHFSECWEELPGACGPQSISHQDGRGVSGTRRASRLTFPEAVLRAIGIVLG